MLRRALVTICVAWFSTLAQGQDEGFRFFLDTAGVGEQNPRPANTPLDFTNPTVYGAGRFYVYLEFGTGNQQFVGVNLRTIISGDATFTGGRFYNHLCATPALRRWQTIVGAVSPTSGSKDWIVSAFKIGSGGYGAKNWAPDAAEPGWPKVQSEDTHFRHDDGSPFGTTLLGYFDVTYTGPANGPPAEVRLGTGDTGCAGVTVTSLDIVYFGFGDAGTTNKGNRTSADPDGYIAPIPEPTTLVALAALAAVMTANRRCR